MKGGGLEDSGGGSNTEDEEEEEEDEFEDAKTDLDYEDFTVSAPPQHRCFIVVVFSSDFWILLWPDHYPNYWPA